MKTFLAALMVFAVGCGVSETEVDLQLDESESESGELSSTKDTFILVRHDMRKCISPLCGGYWVRDLNSTMQDRYVSALDLTGSSVPEEQRDRVTSAPDNELVVFGRLGPKENKFNTRTLTVLDAYRGLPGVQYAATDKFYGVFPTKIACITTPCANLQATRLNRTTGHTMATEVRVDRALKAMVSGDWVMARVRQNRAVLAGTITRSQGNVVVDAAQVFIRVPDRFQSCPKIAPPKCSDGKIGAWTRTDNRCAVPVGCTYPGACAPFEPVCEPGYALTGWQNICPRFACDPEWAL